MTHQQLKKQKREFLRRKYRRGVLGVVNRAAIQYKQFVELSEAAKEDARLLRELAEKHGGLQ